MEWKSPDLHHLPRQTDFPLKIAGAYYCNDSIFARQRHVVSRYEICIRLDNYPDICRDLVDGEPMNIPFPNAIFKTPEMETVISDPRPRNTISFWYPPEQAELLRSWGFFPAEKFWSITLEDNLSKLISRFRHLLICYTSGNMIDQLDWVCFQILRELIFALQTPVPKNKQNRLEEAALYLQHHYDRRINCDTVAAKFGFSHATFFRQWKTHFSISPQEYLRRHRLIIAAHRLGQSSLPVADIVKEIHYASLTAFHRDFKNHFGVTPAAFRRSQVLSEKLPAEK